MARLHLQRWAMQVVSVRELTETAARNTLSAGVGDTQSYRCTLSPDAGEVDLAPDEVGALSHA